MAENNFNQMGFQQQWGNQTHFYPGGQAGGIFQQPGSGMQPGGMPHGIMQHGGGMQIQPGMQNPQFGGGVPYGGMMQQQGMFPQGGGMANQQEWQNNQNNPNAFMNNQNLGWNQNFQQQNQGNNMGMGNQEGTLGMQRQEPYDFQKDSFDENNRRDQSRNREDDDNSSRDEDSRRRRDRRRSSRREGRDRSPRSPRRDDRGRSPSSKRDERSPRRDERDRDRDRSPRRERDRRRDSPDRYERRRREDRRRDDYDNDRWDVRNSNLKPTNTIMLKSLHPNVDKRDIQDAVNKFNRPVLDVRLVQNKETGASRGFAFVEFYQVADAKSWLEENQGRVTIGEYVAHMAFGASKRREDDWYCSQCGTQNFKRREHCFHCSISKIESEQYSEVSATATRVIILNGLGLSTLEDKVCTAINYISAVNLTNVLISKDSHGASRGYCYVELVSLEHSQHLYNTLQGMDPPFSVEDHPVSVCYGKEDYLSRAQGSRSSNSSSQSSSSQSSDSHRERSSSPRRQRRGSRRSSMSVAEKAAVAQEQIQAARRIQLQQQHVSQHIVSEMHDGTDKSRSNSSEKERKSEDSKKKENDSDKKSTNEPDLSTYIYDEASGFYYDSQSGLFYDANSQYFYNATTQQYMYWDSEKNTYIPAPTSSASAEETEKQEQKVTEEKEKEKDKKKTDKTAQARKIAKDMERWAKSMNNAKTAPSSSKKTISFSIDSNAGAADAGFAMLQKKGNPLETQAAVAEAISKNTPSNVLVAYGGGSDSEEEEEVPAPRESIDMEKLIDSLTDWNKLICILCKRQFQSREVLVKHQNVSDLHKQNLEAKKKSLMASIEHEAPEFKYRDRAKERRDKFGSMPPPDNPRRSKGGRAARPPVPYEEPTAGGIKSDNIGNRLLQKMGWNEGTGLGKQKQGITDPIEVSRRAAGAGLGSQGSRYQQDVSGSDDYRTTVHKMTRQRYLETQ